MKLSCVTSTSWLFVDSSCKSHLKLIGASHDNAQLRWKPFELPALDGPSVDFVDGLRTVAGAGDPRARSGMAVHVYTCNASMQDKCEWADFYYP